MITILVTGKDSQLAQCIQSVAANFPNFNFIYKSSRELDITNVVQVTEVFKSLGQIDFCINCAAYTAVDRAESEVEKAYKINVEGVKNIAQACFENQVTLIHISTDFLFDGTSLNPYTEESETNPLNVYGETKLKGELVIQELLSNYFIIRTSWLYSEFGNNFLKTMLRLAKENDEISVVNDQLGSPTYAKDLAEVILKLIGAKNVSYGIYNYSNSGVASWYDFASEIFRLSNSKIKLKRINTNQYPTPAIRPKYSVLDTTKIEESLRIEIPYWKESLRKVI
ncbi:dTDP-4-dehydrorhamnose reductase [Winogradskyella epiphytica]|uniref:dTDP-4-dehydrorhamnose reductase n=1 Tax=Winogradskyella epiphytica TaxID=262005 RepID=A0A2V4X058_9FLAO|nr:dTDP-4-dehydrorhamnose reductase [Winogradskyella epiphytica]PYE83296.1 dTDP-4-dehydrorhamnose reductase [Winogradskyella epiphytica]GGW57127.1 NAD(P)-dependent oxidoreductase [Winogradskyella epiphytica]